MVLLSLIDLDGLVGAMAASLIAAVAFTVVVSLAILGGSKFVDYGMDGRPLAAYGSLALALLASLVAVLIVVAGLYLMVSGR